MDEKREEQVKKQLERLAKGHQGKALIDYLQARINEVDKVSTIIHAETFEKEALSRKGAVHELENLLKYLINLREKKTKGQTSEYL